MEKRSLFAGLFLPIGYPHSVADEYAEYQLWDTIQQVTFFVNTVISGQAIMKFHGVGDANASPVGAAALQISRTTLAEAVSFFARTPGMISRYKTQVAGYRLLSEVLNASGHAIEIIAAIATQMAFLLYTGPILCCITTAMSSATRSVIMQHFAKEGNNGDISLKEGNQDKGGKIIGLIVGIVLLLGLVGVSSDNKSAESASLIRSFYCFLVLSILHVMSNIPAVRSLKIPTNQFATSGGKDGTEEPEVKSFMRRMFLPPGYPQSVAPEYARFQFFSLLGAATGYPKSVVVSMAFWAHVYGVGNSKATPLDAVKIDIFMIGVDCVIGLISGLPFITKRLSYDAPVWQLYSGLLGLVGESLRLAAALAPTPFFFPIVVLSVAISAFAGQSGRMVNAEIQRNWSRSSEVHLVHIAMTSGNQAILIRLLTAASCILYLNKLAAAGSQVTPSPDSALIVFALLQVVNISSQLGQYMSRPSPSADGYQMLHDEQPFITEVMSSSSGPFLERSLST